MPLRPIAGKLPRTIEAKLLQKKGPCLNEAPRALTDLSALELADGVTNKDVNKFQQALPNCDTEH